MKLSKKNQQQLRELKVMAASVQSVDKGGEAYQGLVAHLSAARCDYVSLVAGANIQWVSEAAAQVMAERNSQSLKWGQSRPAGKLFVEGVSQLAA